MVELARAKGVPAELADVQQLPFDDDAFDLVLAAWVLFHLPDLDRGLAEIVRVLRPGGELIAVTNGPEHLHELWGLIEEPGYQLSFDGANGRELLERHFDRVRQIRLEATVTFHDHEPIRRYVAASMQRSHLADRVPPLARPLTATCSWCVFVATTREASDASAHGPLAITREASEATVTSITDG